MAGDAVTDPVGDQPAFNRLGLAEPVDFDLRKDPSFRPGDFHKLRDSGTVHGAADVVEGGADARELEAGVLAVGHSDFFVSTPAAIACPKTLPDADATSIMSMVL